MYETHIYTRSIVRALFHSNRVLSFPSALNGDVHGMSMALDRLGLAFSFQSQTRNTRHGIRSTILQFTQQLHGKVEFRIIRTTHAIFSSMNDT
jgi:hypothetical protein